MTGTASRGAAGTPWLAGVALAAGAGSRLRPLTERTPKALVRVGGRPLLDGAMERLAAAVGDGPGRLAVNAHHHADQVAAAVGARAHLSREEPQALGTAGALAALRGWLGGRDAAVTNADVWMPEGAAALRDLVAGWDRRRCRLLCVPAGAARADFSGADGAPLRYAGSCLLPAAALAALEPVPSGLYEALWRDRRDLDLHVTSALAVDCGTPDDLALAESLAGTPAGGPAGRGAGPPG